MKTDQEEPNNKDNIVGQESKTEASKSSGEATNDKILITQKTKKPAWGQASSNSLKYKNNGKYVPSKQPLVSVKTKLKPTDSILAQIPSKKKSIRDESPFNQLIVPEAVITRKEGKAPKLSEIPKFASKDQNKKDQPNKDIQLVIQQPEHRDSTSKLIQKLVPQRVIHESPASKPEMLLNTKSKPSSLKRFEIEEINVKSPIDKPQVTYYNTANQAKEIEPEQVKVKPLEKSGIFHIKGKGKIVRADSSLCCKLTNQSMTRKIAIQLAENVWLDRFVTFLIGVNSVTMAMFDYETDNRCAFIQKASHCTSETLQSDWNKNLSIIGAVLILIFSLEAIIKIVAWGFINSEKAYLRSNWNKLDFLIVIAGSIEVILDQFAAGKINLRPLRTLRTLRPLKALKTFPAMRKQISALIMSVTGLSNAILFLSVVVGIMSVIGLQLYSGTMYNACRLETIPQGATSWQKFNSEDSLDEPNAYQLCTKTEIQNAPWLFDYSTCPASTVCGKPWEREFTIESDLNVEREDINYGIASFDNIFQSFIAVLQIITLDNWSKILFNLMVTSTAPLAPAIFCIMIIFLASFFLLNLLLAVIMESYMESEIKEQDRIQKELEDEQRQLKEMMNEMIKEKTTSKKDEQLKDIIRLEGKIAQKNQVDLTQFHHQAAPRITLKTTGETEMGVQRQLTQGMNRFRGLDNKQVGASLYNKFMRKKVPAQTEEESKTVPVSPTSLAKTQVTQQEIQEESKENPYQASAESDIDDSKQSSVFALQKISATKAVSSNQSGMAKLIQRQMTSMYKKKMSEFIRTEMDGLKSQIDNIGKKNPELKKQMMKKVYGKVEDCVNAEEDEVKLNFQQQIEVEEKLLMLDVNKDMV